MQLTLELPPELENKLQVQATAQQTTVSDLVTQILSQPLTFELTVEEIEMKYRNEWVDLYETAWDEQGFPTSGIVIAHGANQEELIEPSRQFRLQNPQAKIYSFYAGPLIDEEVAVLL